VQKYKEMKSVLIQTVYRPPPTANGSQLRLNSHYVPSMAVGNM